MGTGARGQRRVGHDRHARTKNEGSVVGCRALVSIPLGHGVQHVGGGAYHVLLQAVPCAGLVRKQGGRVLGCVVGLAAADEGTGVQPRQGGLAVWRAVLR